MILMKEKPCFVFVRGLFSADDDAGTPRRRKVPFW
jgi:hypothetical protein